MTSLDRVVPGLPAAHGASRPVAIAVVVLVHAAIGAALVDGSQRRPVDAAAPAQPTLIQRLSLPPPPAAIAPAPPPPRIANPEPRPQPPAPPPPATSVAPLRTPMPRETVPAPAALAVPPPSSIEAPAAATAPQAPAPALPTPAPPAAPAGPAPAAARAPATSRTEIGVTCPTQVQPEMPRRALQEGITGVVRAQALVRGGAVVEVTILSGPRIFHAAVRAAMLQYRCLSDAAEVVAVQEFAFRVE